MSGALTLNIVLLLLVSIVFSFDVPDCKGQTVQFNQTADEEEYTWYPTKFQGSPPPMFPNDYVCNYQINVPDGWSAMVLMYLNLTTPPIDGAISVQVVSQNQYSEGVSSANGEHFYFIAKRGRIQLATRESNAHFGFAVKWTRHPEKFTPSLGSVDVSSSQPTTFFAFTQNPILITSGSRVSLVVTPPTQNDLIQYLRSVVVYDGPDWNSTCLGSAFQLYNSKRQFVSSGKYMTVQQLRPSYPNGRTILLFQDFENTKDIQLYQGATCQSKDDCGQYTLEGSLGKSAVSTVSFDSSMDSEYITSISGTGNLEVYIGGVTKSKSNLIDSYQIENSTGQFPQEIRGFVRTYVLTGKNGKINSTMLSTAYSESAVIGRNGFISSQNYKSGKPSANQDVSEHLKTPSSSPRVNYLFTIREADFVGNTTLTIYVSEKSEVNQQFVYTSSNRPKINETISVLGDDFYVDYGTFGFKTNGFFLDFEILKSSSRSGLFVVLILACYYL